jgi:hypothetical protein
LSWTEKVVSTFVVHLHASTCMSFHNVLAHTAKFFISPSDCGFVLRDSSVRGQRTFVGYRGLVDAHGTG